MQRTTLSSAPDVEVAFLEKFCPSCGRSYPDTGPDFCEDDGERLVNVTPEPDLIGTVLEDKYDIRSKLGEGGMGTVYLAHQASMGRDVAIKVLRPEYSHNRLAIKRFHREARAASRLAHPNTITVYDSGQSEDGLLYQVIEYLKGKPLSDILEDEGALKPHRAIRIVAQICDSLAEAHEAGIIHRDLKPENIFIEEKYGNPEFVKVLDFGIAKIADGDVTQATATGMICGTPSYMSPEQAMGRELDGRSDIYSLGVLFWELLEDQRPFLGNTPMEVMLKHINEPVPGVPEPVQGPMRGHLKGLFEWVMAKPPQKRPQSCQELKERLLEIASLCPEEGAEGPGYQSTTTDTGALGKNASGTLNTGLAHTPAEEEPAPKRSPLYFGLAALGVVGLGALAVFALGQGPSETRAPGEEAAFSEQAKTQPALKEALEQEAAPAALPAAAPAEAAQEDKANAEAEERVLLKIGSDPEGAQVIEGEGAVLGVTPLELTRSKQSGTLALTFKLKGYQDGKLSVDPAKTPNWFVTLKEVPKEKPSEVSKPRRTKTKAKASKTKSKPEARPSGSSGKSGFSTF